MKNFKKIFGILGIVLLVSVFCTMNVSASSADTNARKAYAAYMSKSQIWWTDKYFPSSAFDFSVIDINNDQVPELYLQNGSAAGYQGQFKLYGYINGVVKEIYGFGNCQAMDAYYPAKGVFLDHGGRMGFYPCYYVKLGKNGTISRNFFSAQVEEIQGNSITLKTHYYSGSSYNDKKIITKEEFQRKKTALIGTASKKVPTLKKNTAANRTRYMLPKPASTAETYNSFIKNTMSKALGVAKTGVTINSSVSSGWGNWCQTNGIVSAFETDLNGDSAKELLVFYLKKAKGPNSYRPYKRILHAAVFTKTGSTVKKRQDIVLDADMDSYMGANINAFVYAYKGQKYIAVQEAQVAQGCRCSWWILTIDKAGKFVLKTAVLDPGYTSGVGLYKLSSKIPLSKLAADTSYYNTGKELYFSETGVRNNSAYVRALKNELGKYGLSVSEKTYQLTSFNSSAPAKTEVMTAARSGRVNMFTINAVYTGGKNNSSKTTCKITDYTKVKNKL